MKALWQQELVDRRTTAQRRLEIGKQLAQMGDPRAGVGVKNGIPDISWQPVSTRGEVTIVRFWQAEHSGEESKIIDRQQMYVEPFYIAQYLTTYAQFQVFVDAADGFADPRWWTEMPEACQSQPLAEQCVKIANNPRDSLSWYQSVAFARWLNHQLRGLELPHPTGGEPFLVGTNVVVRLPTEWEWQWAAQNGSETRDYPWGESQLGYANTQESGLKQAIAVGMYPHGAAGCGAHDMAGNLMEWCLNNKKDLQLVDVASDATKVVRGGDWGYELENAACGYCDDEDPKRMDLLNGCRLVIGLVENNWKL